MHDSEQEHSGITGCRVTYESTIFYNEANKFSIIVVKTSDPRIPPQACSGRYYGDRMLRFTAVGYELPRTKAVELELDGEWVESKYGYQLQVEQWQEIVPQTADGLLAYLGSGLIKGIGPKTAEDIVATFGPDTLNILDNEPEKLLQIRGITEGKLKDIEESYAESRVLRNLMSLLGPFKITPATALKIYQNFGPACVDILKKCPYDLCQISGFGFKRVDGIVRKTDNRLHSTERIKGAVLYTLEDARSKSGHLFLPSEDLVKETLLLLNAPIPIPEQRVRAEEVQETLQQMILHGAVVAYKQYLYSPRVFGQEDDTARMIAERLANISVAENIESALKAVRESLGITLSQKQEQAVRTAFRHGLTIITGSPGTGKTTVLKAIIEVFQNLHPKGKFALMAPTGRASRPMEESTGVDEARTLHSALGLGTSEEIGDSDRVRFVDADLIIVDEFSMVDMWLAQQFFKRIGQHTRVVLVGDPNQLPSVGAGNVFYELIHSGMVPVTVLDWIFRQSKDGLIAYNAKFINEGSTKLYYGNDFVFVDSPTQIETARRIQDIYCKEAAERGIENVQMCRRQAYDMKDKSVLFPKNCATAHDREAERIQKINNAQKNKAFCMAYAGFARKAALSNKELQIVCPQRANDLVDEGKALHHCVGGYIDNVAEGRCLIVFVRRVEEPKKPYVTVEVRDGKIAQIHGDHNSKPTEEVQKFIDLWSRKVLPMALQAA